MRALVTDDDVRVTFGHAHDRCVNIVNNHQGLTVLMAVFNGAWCGGGFGGGGRGVVGVLGEGGVVGVAGVLGVYR